jgi:histidinol-phosphate aminotransferase
MTDELRPQPRPGVMTIDAYMPGKSHAPAGVAKVHKLSANENPFGPSPKVVEAVKAMADALQLYPDGTAKRLRDAIANAHRLNVDNIMVFNGSDEALALLTRAYVGEGDEGIYCEHGFLAYPIYLQGVGATAVIAKEANERTDVDAILAAVTPKTRIVFLANPNNPTGTYLPVDEVRRLHAGLPKNVILVIDAAYAEFVRRNDYEAGIELVANNENVVMTRTFSKVYGLGGARIGWIYAPSHIIEALERIRDPFNVNAMAIEAGIAALADRSHVEHTLDHNEQWLRWTSDELEKLGLRVTPSVGNFILIHFPQDERYSAAKADEYLTARGYLLRRVAGYGFPNALRMTIGLEEANRGVVAALAEFLKA